MTTNDPFDMSAAMRAIPLMQKRIYAIAEEASEMPLEGMIAHLEFMQKAAPTTVGKEEWIKNGITIHALLRLSTLLKEVGEEYKRLKNVR